MSVEWIKISLSGTPIMPVGLFPCIHGRLQDLPGTMEGKELTEEDLNATIANGTPFKLYDPVLLTPAPGPSGGLQIGATALIDEVAAPSPNSYLWINPSTVMAWAPFEDNQEWQDLVAQTVHKIDISNNQIPDDYDGPRIIQ